ncbi:DUF4007 family protein [Variovorax sp. RTB1]|uniref:DUF4007 family protein n=1 Tax=Variovorax sp. RTB1 TaxID=3048631 RepID=UPI002B224C66|nr:DUF4007 family protein [Variovorax sp. RTB1]MEB0114273.1 DUF4007 family protein [Variovorax sp. RTB1]
MIKTSTSGGLTPHFSGHETFPLRQMWLKKAFDKADKNARIQKSVFSDEGSIAAFGVGKNMVASIRHWALACDLVEDAPGDSYPLTDIAKAVFDDDGLDPYSESATTAWLAHWSLAGKGGRSTTWRWLFNHVAAPSFTREELAPPLAGYAKALGVTRLSPVTLTRDLETCLRSYAPRMAGGSPEDFAEPMLGELGLLSEERKGYFAFRRGPKATLTDGMFAYALVDYWDRAARDLSSLAFEAIAYGEGSPGLVFKLDEDSVATRLFELADLTSGAMSSTDTAGLRQVHRKPGSTDELRAALIRRAYA